MYVHTYLVYLAISAISHNFNELKYTSWILKLNTKEVDTE